MEFRIENKKELTSEDGDKIFKYLGKLDYICDICAKKGKFTLNPRTMKLLHNSEGVVPFAPIVLLTHSCGKLITFSLPYLEDAIAKQDEEDLIAS